MTRPQLRLARRAGSPGRRRRLAARALAFAAGAGLMFWAGTGIGQQVAAAGQRTVAINDFAFGPAELKVAPGTRVVWTNSDGEPHTVTSADQPTAFKSGALDTGDKFAYTFGKPGTYRYFCSVHPYMVGTVVVE